MDHQLTNFIRALRSAEVNVSTAETLDAIRAVELIGYEDRAALKRSLDCVLAKSEEEHATFDRLFDRYFTRALPDMPPPDEDAADEDTDNDKASGTDGPSLQDLANSDNPADLAMAMEAAGREANVDQIRFSTQAGFYTRKMLEALGVDRLEQDLIRQLRAKTPEAEAEAERLIAARARVQSAARAHVNAQFDVFGETATEQFMNDYVADKAISRLDGRDMARMKQLIARIAKKLAVKHARRTRRKNRGVLDLRRTLRANAAMDGVPFSVHWKQKKKDRPKIVVFCDVSGSVAQYVRFLLLLLYSLNEVVPDLHSFAFSHRLAPVDDILDNKPFDAAMLEIVNTIGAGSTDYGQALSDFRVNHFSLLDRRTTLLVLGDGRSNYGDPRIDLFREMTSRAKQTIWLSPEQSSLWGSGDSEMLRYKPLCNTVEHCATVKDLARAVDAILASYS